MEHIYKINPSAGYLRNNRSRNAAKKKKSPVYKTDNFSLKDLAKPFKKLSAALDKAIPVAGKITNAVGADTRGLITRSPDVAKATVNSIAAPVTTLAGKTVFGTGQFDNKSAANALNTTLKVAGPVAAGAIAALGVKQLATSNPKAANILNKALTSSQSQVKNAQAGLTPSQQLQQPVSTDPSTLPKTQSSVAAEKIAALPIGSIADTIKSNPILLYGIIGFSVLIFLIVIIKLK